MRLYGNWNGFGFIAILAGLFFCPWTEKAWAQQGVLWIGDSHSVGHFGDAFFTLLRSREESRTLHAYASCGSGVQDWISGGKTRCGFAERHAQGATEKKTLLTQGQHAPLQALIKKHQPAIVLIQLGTNDFSLSEKALKQKTEQLLSAFRGAQTQCLWIGPPPFRREPERPAEFDQRMKKIIEGPPRLPCTYVSSAASLPTATVQQQPDQIHYAGKEGQKVALEWAKARAQNVADALKSPNESKPHADEADQSEALRGY